jgi:hypothetical protein
MEESGAVELAPAHAEAAGRLGTYLDDVKETWRVWLAFGTGVRARKRDEASFSDESTPP